MAHKSAESLEEPRVERIYTFDLMRGFFLIVILLNHLAYYPSGLDIFTGRGLLYVSAAEGFFAISGIVLGIVRGRKLLRQPFQTAAKLLLKRSLQLYVEAVILTVLFTLIAWIFANNPGVKHGVATELSWQTLWSTLTMQYTYGWADFLRYYALFLAGAPIALWLLRRNLWYIVIAISLVIWRQYDKTPGGELWVPLSWQLIFYSSFVVGFYWPTIVRWWRHKLQPWQRQAVSHTASLLFLVSITLSFLVVFNANFWHIEPYETWHYKHVEYFDKDQLPISRLALGVLCFWGLFAIFRRHEKHLMKYLGKLLMPLGANSLYVYTVEAFVVFFAHLFVLQAQPLVQIAPWYINLILSAVAITLVWCATRYEILSSIIPR